MNYSVIQSWKIRDMSENKSFLAFHPFYMVSILFCLFANQIFDICKDFSNGIRTSAQFKCCKRSNLRRNLLFWIKSCECIWGILFESIESVFVFDLENMNYMHFSQMSCFKGT